MKETAVNVADLEQPYGSLRMVQIQRERRMLLSLEAGGQKTPLIVVPGSRPGRYAVVDGHKRLRALKKLKADTAQAWVWDLPGTEALARVYRSRGEGAWSAVEEGALVEELHKAARWPLRRVAEALDRTTGWVSRRLGLVQDLAGPILEAVRRGRIGAHSATTCLLPLSRDNKGRTERLAEKIAAEGTFTSRQIRLLYDHCRRGPAAVADKIVSDPGTFLKALAAANTGMDLSLNPAENRCLDQLRLIGNVSVALARRLPEVWAAASPNIREVFASTRDRFTLLEKTVAALPPSREPAHA
jgi:ParB-like chromosome segregation protein Spo0J